MKIGWCLCYPARNSALPFIVGGILSCIDCGTAANDSAEQRASWEGRKGSCYPERSFHSKLLSISLESIWVRKGKRDTGESEKESKKTSERKFWILSYLQHFHKDSGVSTRKKTHQSFPADSGLLCSPHEAQDFCLRLPVSQQSQHSTNHSPTPSDRRGKMKMVLTKRFQTQPVISFSVCSWVEQSLSL